MFAKHKITYRKTLFLGIADRKKMHWYVPSDITFMNPQREFNKKVIKLAIFFHAHLNESSTNANYLKKKIVV